MSSPTGKRDVIRLRTFAEDVERVRTEKGISEAETRDIVPTDREVVESKGVLKKIKKKSLDLQEQKAGTEIDADGISFDEETATKVVDQSYEVSKSLATEAAEKVGAVDIRAESAGVFGREVEKSAADFLGMKSETKPTVTPLSGATSAAQTAVAPVASKASTSATAEYAGIEAMPSSVLGDEAARVHELTDNEVGGGEIVSDKKRDRFKLFPAIGTAVSGWVGTTKERIEDAQKEKHTIEKTDQRIETIKAAAQPKTLAPNTDFDQVAERLRQTAKKTTNDAPVVLKPKEATAASWTHSIPEGGEAETESIATEPASAVAPSETLAPAPVVADEVPASISPLPIETTSEAPIVREIKDAQFSLSDLEQIAGTNTQRESIIQPGELAAAAHQQIATQEAVRQATVETGGKTFVMPSLSLPSIKSGRELLPTPTLAIIVVVIAIVSGIGTSMYFFWQPNGEVVVPAATTNPLFTAQLQADVFLDPSHAATMGTLLSAVQSTPGSLYLYLTRDSGQTVVPPNEVMDFLAPIAPGTFTRSVTNVSFGSLDNRPFIILRVNNFDNAFSGMLAWEQTMSSDLAPLFGPAVTESLDAQARTSSQTRGAFFKDIVASNLSSRLLVNERGEDRIIYTFLDRQTILITTDRLQLANILPLVR